MEYSLRSVYSARIRGCGKSGEGLKLSLGALLPEQEVVIKILPVPDDPHREKATESRLMQKAAYPVPLSYAAKCERQEVVERRDQAIKAFAEYFSYAVSDIVVREHPADGVTSSEAHRHQVAG